MKLDLINLNYVLEEIRLELRQHRDWLSKEIAYIEQVETKIEKLIEMINGGKEK